MAAPIPEKEQERLAALGEFNILDTNQENSYDDIVRLAAFICGTPIAAVSLIDAHRQWFKSILGLNVTETPRDVSFCAHTILHTGLTVVPDTRDDERFAANPFVTDNPGIRFYAGAPLVTDDGYALGSLCVIDTVPRSFTEEQAEALRILAHQVMAQMKQSQLYRQVQREVEERKRIEAALRESEGKFRSIIAATPVAYALNDESENITFLNPEFIRTFGYTLADLPTLEDWWLRAYPDPSYRQWVATTWQSRLEKAKRDGTAFEAMQLTVRCKDGTTRTVLAGTDALGDSYSGTHLISLYDITDRERAERGTREARERLDGILGSLEEIVWSFSAIDFELLYINPAAERISGRFLNDFKSDSRTWSQMIHPDDAERVAWSQAEVLEKGSSVREFRIIRADGQIRWLRERVALFHDAQGAQVRVDGIATDITQYKITEQQLIQSEKLAAVGQLVAGVAHEINNPLAVIYANAQLLEMHDDPQVKEDGRTIRSMTERTSRIVRSLQTFARGDDSSQRSVCTLGELIGNTVEVCVFSLRKEQVHLIMELDDNVPAVVANDNQVQQVLLNLITNATHALRGNSLADRRIVVATCHGAAGFARVTVTDNGCGMSEEISRRIFEPFYTTKDIGEGTGLGLSVCHGIVLAHGGRLSVDSKLGEGTTFTIELPCVVPGQDY